MGPSSKEEKKISSVHDMIAVLCYHSGGSNRVFIMMAKKIAARQLCLYCHTHVYRTWYTCMKVWPDISEDSR